MNNNKEEQLNNLLYSMKGAPKAKPPTSLFSKIEQELASQSKVIQLKQLSVVAAALIGLLILNLWTIQALQQNRQLSTQKQSNNSNISLMSNYKIYQ